MTTYKMYRRGLDIEFFIIGMGGMMGLFILMIASLHLMSKGYAFMGISLYIVYLAIIVVSIVQFHKKEMQFIYRVNNFLYKKGH